MSINALLIKDGTVQNVIVVESVESIQSESPEFFAQWDMVIEHTGQAWIGWTWNGTEFVPPSE